MGSQFCIFNIFNLGMNRYLVILFSSTICFYSSGQETADLTLSEQITHYHQLSDSASKNENYEKAIAYKFSELQVLLRSNQIDLIVRCGERLGLLYYHLGQYHQSLIYFEKAANFYENTGNLFSYATIKVNEANVYTRLGKYPQAIHKMRLAEEVYIEDTIKYANQLVGLYTNLGLAYFDLPNLDSAIYYYDKADQENQIAQNPMYSAVILNNRGDVFLAIDSLDEAEKCLTSALEIASDLNYYLLIATTKLNLGTIEMKRANYSAALNNLNDALSIYENLNSLYFLAETNIALSECYEEMGNHPKSLFYLKEFNKLEDSLKGAETLDRIANLEMQIALNEEQQRYELVQQEKELAETKSRHQRTYLILLIGLILLGVAVAILFIRGLRTSLERNKLKSQQLQQRQKLLENELNFKRKEIENFSAYILEKNNILNEVKGLLEKIQTENPNSTHLKNAVNTVKHNLHLDQDRKELDLKIDQAHQEFISRLLDQHPKLTKTEQRLCSLLLMDLSTKDISNIMNVAPESVKKSRNRLRKKLELEPKTDLQEFLKSI